MKKVLIAAAGATFLLGMAAGAGASSFTTFHNVHLGGEKGDFKLTCFNCHGTGGMGMRPSPKACEPCHSPDGAIDGVYDPVVGAWANRPGHGDTSSGSSGGRFPFARMGWSSGSSGSSIYNADGSLKPGKELWCLGCHDDGHSTVRGVAAPNVAGKTLVGDWESPAGVVESDVQGAENLIDGDIDTGNPFTTASDLVFDLGTTRTISHIRLYTVLDSQVLVEVYGSTDQASWTRILYGRSTMFARPSWEVGPKTGWNEYRLDKFMPIRYVKLVFLRPSSLVVDSLREFQVRSNLSYGYLVNGHKITCDNCHDTQHLHIDGIARTYRADLNNYTVGYRLKDVQVGSETVPAMEVPRVGKDNGEHPRTDNDFALCFKCHDRYKLLGDAYGDGEFFQYPLQTNFRNDDHVDANGNVVNEHLRHLRGRGPDGNDPVWDSDWDGTPDSSPSCTACHNVHGSPNPLMLRHGELTSTPGTVDKVPMFNFQFKGAGGRVNPDLQNVMDSTGGETQFFKGGPGTIEKNHTCKMCHGDRVSYRRAPVFIAKPDTP